jgi:hypothetical protein
LRVLSGAIHAHAEYNATIHKKLKVKRNKGIENAERNQHNAGIQYPPHKK